MNEKLRALLDQIQATAAKLGDTAADAAYGVGKKAEVLLSTAKLNIKIAELKQAANREKQEVGEMIYATHTGSPTDSDVLLEKLQDIDKLYAQIAELETQLGKAERVPACADCGAALHEGDRFCRECGSPLP